jgi:16S rRNA (adenine1518-N6/adenine1519-N6)-dimethyltransferase
MIAYDSPVALRAFLEEHGLGARKRFGQNFLIKRELRARLIDALAFEQGDAVWEIGPGLGAMTALLLERHARVTAFEIDAGFCRVLRELFEAQTNFTLVEGDALLTCLERYVSGGNAPYFLGNLPYNIGGRLIAEFIEQKCFFPRMVITVQREVAQRMLAVPHSKDYSSFSVLCASAYTVTPLMVLKGACFYPVPHVDSQAVRLDLRTERKQYPALFYPLVRALFASRRKTVRYNLREFARAFLVTPARNADAALAHCGINGTDRAEDLGIEEFAALAEAMTAFTVAAP